MDGLLKWIGNILYFLIFLTIAENLLPGQKYNRYIRLFAGMILILLVIEPVTRTLHLEDRLAGYFKSFSFRQDAEDLSREILGVEKQRLSQIIDRYEQAVETDVRVMAAEMGYDAVSAEVMIDQDPESGNYGSVVYIEMKIGQQKSGDDSREEWAVQAVGPVEPVAVSVEGEEQRNSERSTDTHQREQSRNEELDQLKRKVERYYGLETGKVEIRFEGE